jgi:hypothetical protein
MPRNSPRKGDALLATGASQWIKGPKKIVKPSKGATDSQQMTLFKGDSVSPQECDKFARDAIIQAGFSTGSRQWPEDRHPFGVRANPCYKSARQLAIDAPGRANEPAKPSPTGGPWLLVSRTSPCVRGVDP